MPSLRRALSVVGAVAALTTAACGEDEPIFSDTTTTVAAAPWAGSAQATVDVAGPAFSGVRQFVQDPANQTLVRPGEETVQLHLVDSGEGGTARILKIGGGVRLGSTAKSSTTLTVSYLADGIILTSTRGECTVKTDEMSATVMRGSLECVDVPVGTGPLTLRATFSATATGAAPGGASATSSSTSTSTSTGGTGG